jgi:CheY-like chemotaxis protein
VTPRNGGQIIEVHPVRRALVVDDSADAREMLATFLDLAGYAVSTARSGREALEACVALLPDLIFLDIGMPELDGYEVCSRLRALPSGSEAAIYAVTGFGSDQHRARSMRAGFDGHFLKPLDLDAILTVLACRYAQ